MTFGRVLLTLLSFNNFFFIISVERHEVFLDKKINGSGLYYEPISKLQVYSEIFDLLIHVNISVYFEKYYQLNSLFKNNEDLCHTVNQDISVVCSTFQPVLFNARMELAKRFNNLNALQKGTRIKRGLINAVGEFQEWAFGTVGNNAYKQLEQSISKDENKNKQTLSLMKSQVKLVQSTVNQISNISSTLSQTFISLQNQYNNLTAKITKKK